MSEEVRSIVDWIVYGGDISPATIVAGIRAGVYRDPEVIRRVAQRKRLSELDAEREQILADLGQETINQEQTLEFSDE